MPREKQYTTEQLAERNRAARREWAKRNPDKIKEKQKRQDERKRLARNAPITEKVCSVCGLPKPLVAYPKRGPGIGNTCLACEPPQTREQRLESKRESAKRYREMYPDRVQESGRKNEERRRLKRIAAGMVPRVPKPATPKPVTAQVRRQNPYPLERVPKETTFTPGGFVRRAIAEGWSIACGYGEFSGGMIAFIRFPLIMYMRTNGLKTYGVLCDDSGERYPRVHMAESAAKRVWK